MAYTYSIDEDNYGLWLAIETDAGQGGIVKFVQLHDADSPNYEADMPAMQDLARRLGCEIKRSVIDF